VSLEPRPIDPNVSKEAKRVLGLSPSDIKRASEAGHTEVPAETTNRGPIESEDAKHAADVNSNRFCRRDRLLS
jgi:hypothetical protein